MRKLIFTVLFGLILAVPAFALNKAPVKELIVASDGEFTTISAALASLPDPNPDTNPVIIKVMPGTYSENFFMKSNVHLQGSAYSVTTIVVTAGGPHNYGISVANVNNAEISGFTIDNPVGNDSIHIESSAVIVRNNRFTRGYPIDIYKYLLPTETPSQVSISDNLFDGPYAYYGVSSDGTSGSSTTISHNKFVVKDCYYGGVKIRGDANIVDNIFVGDGTPTGEAVGITATGKVFVSGNIIDNIGGTGIGGYRPIGANPQIVIRGNTITNCTNAGINYADLAIIAGNVIKGNGGCGINSGGNAITNNEIVGNATDICGTPANLSFNTLDTTDGATPSSLNVKSDGTPW